MSSTCKTPIDWMFYILVRAITIKIRTPNIPHERKRDKILQKTPWSTCDQSFHCEVIQNRAILRAEKGHEQKILKGYIADDLWS